MIPEIVAAQKSQVFFAHNVMFERWPRYREKPGLWRVHFLMDQEVSDFIGFLHDDVYGVMDDFGNLVKVQ